MTRRTVWAIAINELLRLLRRREILLFGLALPMLIIVLIGLTFGSTGSINLGVIDGNRSERSIAMVDHLDHVDGVRLERYHDASALRRDVRIGKLQAGLVIPVSYADELDAGAARLAVIIDPKSAGVASALATIDGAVTQQGVQEGAVRFVAETEGADAARRSVARTAASLASVGTRDVHRITSEVKTGSFSYTAPANLVLFVFINTFVVSTIIAFDRQSGRIARMLASPNGSGSILLGLGLSKLAFAVTQSTILVGVGTLVFGVQWGDPVAAAALVVSFAVLATSVGLLVGSWVKDADQAQAIGIPLAVALGMLGGCMWPLDIVPRAMQILGHLTPHAWAMDVWQEIIFDGGGLGDILPNLLVLLGGAAVVGLLAARQLRRSVIG